MYNKKQCKEILLKAIDSTRCRVNAALHGSEQKTTRFANSEISQNVSISDMDLTVTVFEGRKSASCSTNVLTDEGIKELVRDAEELLKYVPEGEFEAFEFSKEPVEEKTSDGRLSKAFGVDQRVELIKEGISFVEPGFYGAGALSLTQTTIGLASCTKGFRYSSSEFVDFNTVVTHNDGTAGSGACCSYTSPPDVISKFKKAQATAKAAMGAKSPSLGAFTVVLSPSAFGSLVNFMSYMLNAKAVDDGISFAVGKLGEKVFGENLTLLNAVGHPELMPLLFDMEGNPGRPLTLINKGVVNELLYDNVIAKRHGKESTGNAVAYGRGGYPFHLLVEPGVQPIDDIIAGTEKGIFINEFHYTNFVNPRNLQITGLTRNGAFFIENGKLTEPMGTVRFTESLLDAFNNITAISKEQELVSGWATSLMPGVRIENFHFTSKP